MHFVRRSDDTILTLDSVYRGHCKRYTRLALIDYTAGSETFSPQPPAEDVFHERAMTTLSPRCARRSLTFGNGKLRCRNRD